MFTFKTVVKDLGFQQLQKTLESLKKEKPYVKIGVFGDRNKRRDKRGVSNVDVAVWQEFGTWDAPARSFIRSPWRTKREENLRKLRELISAQFTSKGIKEGIDLKKALAEMGKKIAADFKASAPGTAPPDLESTVKRKEDARTLVDSEQMVNSITYKVVTGQGKEE